MKAKAPLRWPDGSWYPRPMILDARSGVRGTLWNADTGQPIHKARWANLNTGDWEALATLPDGQVIQPVRLIRGRCRLRFVPAGTVAASTATAPAEVTMPVYPLESLPGQRAGTPIVAILGQECECRGCHRLATWRTADEEELEPAVGPEGALAERARVVRYHLWCDWHYQPPLFTSLRGVLKETHPRARPQW